MIPTRVKISRLAEKQLSKVPEYIREKLYYWVERVEEFGIEEIRKIKVTNHEY